MAEDYLTQLMKQIKDKNAPETEKDVIPEPKPSPTGPKKISQIEEEIIVSEKNSDEAFIRAPTYSTETITDETEGKQKTAPIREMDAAAPLLSLKKEIIQRSDIPPEATEKTTAEKEVEKSQKIELKTYGKVKIFRIPEKPLPYYFIPTPRPTSAERKIINTIKEATTRIISIAPYKVRNAEQRRIVYKQKVIEILKNSPSLKIPESRINFYAEAVVREMVGYGIIDDLIKDDRLEEIMIIGPKQPTYVFHREFEMMSTNIEFFSEQEIEDLINKIARDVGRRVDVSSPLLDARLPDGSRVNATIPPASISGGTLTIRKFKADPYSIIDLIKLGTISSEAAAFLWLCVEGMGVKPANIIISGGTGSGKTTLLNVLTAFVPERERIITIEDTAELSLPLKHWIRMEARPPGLEGTGELKMDILTKNSLRMRPDRIIVGEVRHEEAFTLFTALNTGHDGALAENSLVQLSDGNIIEIGKLAEKYFSKNTPIKESTCEFVEVNESLFVPSMNKQTLKIEHKPITRIWRKKHQEKLIRLKLKSGKELLLTKDHPVYRIQGGIQEIAASEAKENDCLVIPREITVETEKKITEPHLLGMIYGDGHLGKEGVEFVNTEKSVLNAFSSASKRITQNKVTKKDFENYSRITFFDKKTVETLNKEFSIPIGNKTKTFKMEEKILRANMNDLAELLKGLYDCESHVNLKANCIQFSTSNPDLAKKLPLILQRYGILASSYAQEKDGKGNLGPYYRISVYGKENIEKFAEKIGFAHEKKKEKLSALLGKSRKSQDLFPNIERLLRDARAEARLTQKEVGALIGNKTPGTINSYETGARKPSREQLLKIIKRLKTQTSEQIRIMAESELRFEKIVSITEENYDDYVYDFTVEGNHNYVANGTVVSNCMGTVHANSPQETIIRVTNPPMNVPQIMLSGLDLIIIEHRLHDRKKGTIRRITEMAEVYNALEGSPKTEIIYQWNPVKDSLERTLTNSRYINNLQIFSGLNKEQIKAEIELRKTFLEELAKQNIRSILAVSSATKKFLEKRAEAGETR